MVGDWGPLQDIEWRGISHTESCGAACAHRLPRPIFAASIGPVFAINFLCFFRASIDFLIWRTESWPTPRHAFHVHLPASSGGSQPCNARSKPIRSSTLMVFDGLRQ